MTKLPAYPRAILSAWMSSCTIVLFLAAACVASPAQVFNDLVYFVGSDGANPYASLVQGPDGQFYGTATDGGGSFCGSYGCGTIFKVDSSGNLTTLHSFNGSDGWDPTSTLSLDVAGNFYGSTFGGSGTIFKLAPDGTLTTLYSFCSQPVCADGANPYSGVILATDGNFYGTTYLGGAYGKGTVFKLTPAGVLTTLHSFCAKTNCPDGNNPVGPLLEASDGTLYGTTPEGGGTLNPAGTVFTISSRGGLKTIHYFSGNDAGAKGSGPEAGLIQASNGAFYGTTVAGGQHETGTVYKMKAAGGVTIVYSFCDFGCNGLGYPYAGVIEGSDGMLYGTAGYGAVYQLNPTGSLNTLFTFDFADGEDPNGALVQGTDGNFYGTTYFGGASTNACYGSSCGVLFSLSNGLGPFVKTVPVTGTVGTTVLILGNSLSSTTNVTFNGTPATFTVVSAMEITTSVPVGATTGKVQVTGSNGALSTPVVFSVRQ